jgi:hypothetical protein
LFSKERISSSYNLFSVYIKEITELTVIFDFSGTLTPEFGEFSSERVNESARFFARYPLRRGARQLLLDLIQQGHRIVVCSDRKEPGWRIFWWFRMQGIPVVRVIRRVQSSLMTQTMPTVLLPPVKQVGLYVDDDPLTIQAAEARGWNTVLVYHNAINPDDWTLLIRYLCGLPDPSRYAVHRPSEEMPSLPHRLATGVPR